ncbi:hypothetical protein FB451DRAFT_1362264 [Mycena latifolia]|nr:hypothetical protein FB451DRAFT_1362264 [Mycena latifolia]
MTFIKDILDRHPEILLDTDPAAMARLLSIQPSGDKADLRWAVGELYLLGTPDAIIWEVVAAWRDLTRGTASSPADDLAEELRRLVLQKYARARRALLVRRSQSYSGVVDHSSFEVLLAYIDAGHKPTVASRFRAIQSRASFGLDRNIKNMISLNT